MRQVTVTLTPQQFEVLAQRASEILGSASNHPILGTPAKPFVSASALGRLIGLSPQTVLELERAGAITAEIHEGRLIRFDAARVKTALAARAAARLQEPTAQNQ